MENRVVRFCGTAKAIIVTIGVIAGLVIFIALFMAEKPLEAFLFAGVMGLVIFLEVLPLTIAGEIIIQQEKSNQLLEKLIKQQENETKNVKQQSGMNQQSNIRETNDDLPLL